MCRELFNPCLYCDGLCCTEIVLLSYEKDSRLKRRRKVNRNNKRLVKYPFLEKKGKYFECNLFDPNATGGHCEDYENRPQFCKDFMCRKGGIILDLTSEPWYAKSYDHA